MATGHHQTQHSRAQPLGILGRRLALFYETWRYKNSLRPSDEGREQMVFPMIFVGKEILLQKGFEDSNEIVCINTVYKVLRMELHTPNFWIANHLNGLNASVL